MAKTTKKTVAKKLKDKKDEIESFQSDLKKLGEKKIKKVFKKHKDLFLEYDSDASESDDNDSLLKLANKIKDSQKKKKQTESKIKKKKSKRKSGKPTKPIPSYFIFNKEKHPLTKEKYPDMTPREIKKKISEIWKSMSDEEKKPYNEKAAEEKERYTKELEEYNKNHTGDTSDSDSEPEKKKKGVRDPDRPKKYTTAFFLFCNQKRKELKEQNPESSEKPPDTAKRASIEWRAMTDEEKKPYIEKESVSKKKYLEDIEAYRKRKSEEEAKMQLEEKSDESE